MVKMLKASDEKIMQDTPITSSKLLDEPKNEIIKWEEFKTSTRPRKRKKSNQFQGDGEQNSQLDRKPPEND